MNLFLTASCRRSRFSGHRHSEIRYRREDLLLSKDEQEAVYYAKGS